MRPIKYDNSTFHKKRREQSMRDYEKRGKYVCKLRYLEKTLGIEKTDTSNLSIDYIKQLIRDLTLKKLEEKLVILNTDN